MTTYRTSQELVTALREHLILLLVLAVAIVLRAVLTH